METIKIQPTTTTATETNSLPKPTHPCCRENGDDTEFWLPDTGLGRAIAEKLSREGWKRIQTRESRLQEYQLPFSMAAMAVLLEVPEGGALWASS